MTLRELLSRYRFRDLARRGVRGTVNPLLLSATLPRDYDLRETLLIVGSARSGTTWLAELVSTIPRSALIFEPLNLSRMPRAKAAGFRPSMEVLANDEWPEGEAFLRGVLEGKILNHWSTSYMNLRRAIRPERVIVKFIRANLMLSWMIRKFPTRPPAMIIRHPCATVASQLAQGWMSGRYRPRVPKMFADSPEWAEIIGALEGPVEFLAAIWCIWNYVPLALRDRYPIHVLSYESLTREGEREATRLFEAWDIPVPATVGSQLRTVSQSTKKDSALHQAGDPLMKWRASLSTEQVSQILRVTRKFGMDFYDDSAEPDYDRLYGDRPVRDVDPGIA